MIDTTVRSTLRSELEPSLWWYKRPCGGIRVSSLAFFKNVVRGNDGSFLCFEEGGLLVISSVSLWLSLCVYRPSECVCREVHG